jgi:hypothetical protein
MKTLIAATAAIVTATALAGPAHADTNGDFLRQLSGAGIGYANPADTVALGQSICPLLVEPGKNFASAVSKVRNNGVSPEMAAFFAGIAIQMYCPSMMSSIADGTVLNQLSALDQLNGLNQLSGLAGMSALPGLTGFGIPGL